MKILKCNKINGKWQALVLMVSGGTCYFTATYLDELIEDIKATNEQLKEII